MKSLRNIEQKKWWYTTSYYGQEKQVSNRYFKFIILAIMCLALSLPTQADEEIRGNKKLVTTKKALDNFNKIDLKIFGNITVQCGAMPMVEITTDENIHPYISVDVKGNTFTISSEGWIEPSKLNIVIQLAFLNDFKISGWGNVTINNVSSENLQVHAPTGNIQLNGRVKNLSIENGTGNINAENLEAEIVYVNKKGWGNISVWATLSLELKGNYGAINYKGSPELKGQLTKDPSQNQEQGKAPMGQPAFVTITLKNNSNSKQDFIINGPLRGKHIYGFPVAANSTRKESCPVGSKIYLETLGLKGKLLVEIKADDEGKTIELFQ